MRSTPHQNSFPHCIFFYNKKYTLIKNDEIIMEQPKGRQGGASCGAEAFHEEANVAFEIFESLFIPQGQAKESREHSHEGPRGGLAVVVDDGLK